MNRIAGRLVGPERRQLLDTEYPRDIQENSEQEPRMNRSSARRSKQLPNQTKSAKPLDGHVGSRVRARRLMLGLSQTELGDALKITFQQVQKYEKGTNRIGASRLQEIANVLKVPISFFFEDWIEGGSRTDHTDTGLTDITKALATNAGIELMRAFVKIKDENVRRQLVHLATAIAEGAGSR